MFLKALDRSCEVDPYRSHRFYDRHCKSILLIVDLPLFVIGGESCYSHRSFEGHLLGSHCYSFPGLLGSSGALAPVALFLHHFLDRGGVGRFLVAFLRLYVFVAIIVDLWFMFSAV